jgi:hypothetical protein
MTNKLQKAIEDMTYNMMSTILAHPDKFSDEKVKIAKAKFNLEKVKGDEILGRPKKTASLDNMVKLGENRKRAYEEPPIRKAAEKKNKGGLTKPKMMGGGMAYGKQHMYVAGGSVRVNKRGK